MDTFASKIIIFSQWVFLLLLGFLYGWAHSDFFISAIHLPPSGFNIELPKSMRSLPFSPIPAKGYLLMDANSGKVMATSDNQEARLPPASLTKMMTLYLASRALQLGHIQLTDIVKISHKAGTTLGSRMFIVPGSRVYIQDLIQGIIVQSGNDASIALAEHLAGSEADFVTLMNQQAKALAMTGTHFVNATGLPEPNHYTTLVDIALLARGIIRDFPEYYKWYAQKSFRYNGIHQANRNRLLGVDASVDGIKTGHTEEAGYCLAASAVRDSMRLIAIILDAASDVLRTQAGQSLLDDGFQFFETHKLYSARERVSIPYLSLKEEAIGLKEDVYITIPRGSNPMVKQQLIFKNPLMMGLDRTAQVGEVRVFWRDECLVSVPLVVLSEASSDGGVKAIFKRAMLALVYYWPFYSYQRFGVC